MTLFFCSVLHTRGRKRGVTFITSPLFCFFQANFDCHWQSNLPNFYVHTFWPSGFFIKPAQRIHCALSIYTYCTVKYFFPLPVLKILCFHFMSIIKTSFRPKLIFYCSLGLAFRFGSFSYKFSTQYTYQYWLLYPAML